MNNEEINENKDNVPRIFISYAWTNEEHQKDIIEFGTELMEKGQMDVILDVWDAKEGDDLNYFMEKNVTSPKTDYILVILNEEYQMKADGRKDGVGKETQILSEEVYNNVENSKVLPIIWERDIDGNAFVPIYLKARKYFDVFDDYAKGLEKLIRFIHNLPEYPKPKIGKLSDDFKNNKPVYPNLRKYFKTDLSKLLKNKTITVVVNEFLDEYYNYLCELKISQQNLYNIDLINEVAGQIENYTPLRDYFIEFFEKIIKFNEVAELDIEIVIDFFVKLQNKTRPSYETKSKQQHVYIYDFILRELFLYSIAIGLKNRNYSFLSDILNSPYYFENELIDYNDSQKFTTLDNRGLIRTEDILYQYYLNVENISVYSGIGKNLISRLHNHYRTDDFVDADLLCCYISYLNFYKEENHHDWLPYTYAYKQSRHINIFRKLSSKRHFMKVKDLFEVDSAEKLKEKIKRVDGKFGPNYRMENTFPKYVKAISEYINLEKISTER